MIRHMNLQAMDPFCTRLTNENPPSRLLTRTFTPSRRTATKLFFRFSTKKMATLSLGGMVLSIRTTGKGFVFKTPAKADIGSQYMHRKTTKISLRQRRLKQAIGELPQFLPGSTYALLNGNTISPPIPDAQIRENFFHRDHKAPQDPLSHGP